MRAGKKKLSLLFLENVEHSIAHIKCHLPLGRAVPVGHSHNIVGNNFIIMFAGETFTQAAGFNIRFL